jgi:hypothetical protein
MASTGESKSAEILDVVQGLTQRIEVLEKRLDLLTKPAPAEAEDMRGDVPAGPATAELPPLCWDELAADELAANWEAFIVWFDHVVVAHRLSPLLPRRWWQHPGLVAHLVAYWRWYLEVSIVTPSGQGTALWHDAFLRFAETVWPGYISRGDSRSATEVSGDGLREAVQAEAAQRRASAKS